MSRELFIARAEAGGREYFCAEVDDPSFAVAPLLEALGVEVGEEEFAAIVQEQPEETHGVRGLKVDCYELGTVEVLGEDV